MPLEFSIGGLVLHQGRCCSCLGPFSHLHFQLIGYHLSRFRILVKLGVAFGSFISRRNQGPSHGRG